MEKTTIRIYIFFLIIACVIVGTYAVLGIGRNPSAMFGKNTKQVISPISEDSQAEVYSATFDAAEIVKAGGSLSFTTIFKDVHVYADEKLIYENVGSGSLLMRSTGNVWHSIAVTDDYRNIAVTIQTVYGEAVTPPEFVAGDYYNLRSMMIAGSFVPFVISILDIIFGISIVIYFSVIGRNNRSNIKLLPFGVAATMIGIWSAGETNTMVILLDNRALGSVIAFLVLTLIPIPYVEYIHLVLWPEDKRIYWIPIFLCLFDFVLVVGLALSGVMDLKRTVGFTHTFWGIAVLYIIVAAVKALRNNKVKKDRSAVFNCAAMLILIAVASLEIVYYWTGLRSQNDILGRTLIFAYITVLGCRGILESIKDIENGRMAEYYKELANTDSLTGLANRTAFNHDVDELTSQEEYSFISMDLNNLKTVNDTRGHQAGDRYIKNAADIISRVFGGDGTCYRIGGDEFCAIIKKSGSDAIARTLLAKMVAEIESHNVNEPADPVAIAWGYETNTPELARDYKEVLHRADEKMYDNKRLQKAEAKEI